MGRKIAEYRTKYMITIQPSGENREFGSGYPLCTDYTNTLQLMSLILLIPFHFPVNYPRGAIAV